MPLFVEDALPIQPHPCRTYRCFEIQSGLGQNSSMQRSKQHVNRTIAQFDFAWHLFWFWFELGSALFQNKMFGAQLLCVCKFHIAGKQPKHRDAGSAITHKQNQGLSRCSETPHRHWAHMRLRGSHTSCSEHAWHLKWIKSHDTNYIPKLRNQTRGHYYTSFCLKLFETEKRLQVWEHSCTLSELAAMCQEPSSNSLHSRILLDTHKSLCAMRLLGCKYLCMANPA